jgi:hypothetical protein
MFFAVESPVLNPFLCNIIKNGSKYTTFPACGQKMIPFGGTTGGEVAETKSAAFKREFKQVPFEDEHLQITNDPAGHGLFTCSPGGGQSLRPSVSGTIRRLL